MSKLQRYSSYKESGVEWIGEMPEHWEIIKFKHLFYEKKKTHDISLNCGSISFGKVVEKDDEKIQVTTKASYQVLNNGEFLINPLNLNYDLKSLRIALSELDVVVSSGYIIIKSRIDMTKEYFKWLLHRYDIAFMKTLGAGVRQTLNFNDIGESLMINPPLPEQTAIASYLDTKTAQIDQAISQKEQLIELLKERKQIVINEAVTKGINPNVLMKDSGVGWIEEIPEHWEVKPLKYVLQERSERSENGDETLFMVSQIHGLVVRADYHDKAVVALSNIGSKKVHQNDLVFNKLKAHLGVFFKSTIEEVGLVSPDYAVYYSKGIIYDMKYLELLFRHPAYISHFICKATGIVEGLIRLYTSDLFSLKIPIPPRNELIEIMQYIGVESAKIDTAIELQQNYIAKLKEYKATLIDSIVTGKVRVIA